MTTSPYSKDLRKKVINYLSQWGTQKVASEIFAVHRNTISRWWVRYNKEGNYEAKARLGPKSKIDYREVELFVRNNPDTKLASVGDKFGISAWHAIRILRKLNFSYKKTFSYVEASKEKRDKYREAIRDIQIEKLVYIDESGIDMTTCKDRG